MIPSITKARAGFLGTIHPIVKVACALLLFIFCLFVPKVPLVILYFVFLFSILVISRLGLTALKVSILLLPIAILVGSINVYFGNTTVNGFHAGIRILFMGLSVIMFAFTTTPSELVRSMETVRVPRPLTLGTLVAMRFFPVFIEEWKKVVMSARLRGGLSRGPGFYYRALVVPMVYKIFTVSDTLSTSLHTRGFTLDGKRTTYKEMPFRMRDAAFFITFLAVSALLAVA